MRARRPLRGARRGSARRRQARPARHRALLRDAGCDDLFHQRFAVVGLQALRLEHRRRIGVRRFLGARSQDPRTEPVDTVLCRTPLRRRARRRDADGAAARLSRQGDRRYGGARQERAALPVPAIRRTTGRTRRHGGQLSGSRILTSVAFYRRAAAILPPSTVVTSAVVLSATAWCRKACATSSAVTSRPRRLPAM